MFWSWSGFQSAPSTVEERVQRVQEFKELISADAQVVAQLRAGGRDPQSEGFATRWLTSRAFDLTGAMQAVSMHCEWLDEQAGIVPVTDGHVPNALVQNKDELFLQVRLFAVSAADVLMTSCARKLHVTCRTRLKHTSGRQEQFYFTS